MKQFAKFPSLKTMKFKSFDMHTFFDILRASIWKSYATSRERVYNQLLDIS